MGIETTLKWLFQRNPLLQVASFLAVSEGHISVTFLAGHDEMCPPYGGSTWRPADRPTTRRSTWTWCLFKEKPRKKSMWIGVLWAGLRVAMWITHVGGKFRHGLLEKSLNIACFHLQCFCCTLVCHIHSCFVVVAVTTSALHVVSEAFEWVLTSSGALRHMCGSVVETGGGYRPRIKKSFI